VLAFSSFAGLSQTQYPILIAIQEFDGRRRNRINQLAERLYLTGASVTREVNRLLSDGLIEKAPHPSDGRRVQLAAATRRPSASSFGGEPHLHS
jgi:DNA-binding MarR family transcriptional regulator